MRSLSRPKPLGNLGEPGGPEPWEQNLASVDSGFSFQIMTDVKVYTNTWWMHERKEREGGNRKNEWTGRQKDRDRQTDRQKSYKLTDRSCWMEEWTEFWMNGKDYNIKRTKQQLKKKISVEKTRMTTMKHKRSSTTKIFLPTHQIIINLHLHKQVPRCKKWLPVTTYLKDKKYFEKCILLPHFSVLRIQ